mmetsp:Transcript_59885/g.165714  ORF Transcript_59885/g.165714 Transcript_59885/m.165714 type:complete len:262 (+) Transcript_59885:1812-2597(+)
MLCIHQRNDVTDCLQEGSEALAAVLADALPQGPQHGIEGLNAVRRGGFRQCCQRQRGDGPHLLLFILEAMRDDIHHLLEVRQHCTTHEDRYLLHDLDARVPGLPALLRLADSPQEEEQCRNSQRRSHDGKGTGGCVADVLVRVVYVRAHGRDHGRQACSLGKIADDLAAFHTGKVILINQQRLDHDEDLMHVWSHHVVKLVQHTVYDLYQEVPLLVLQGAAHEQRQDLVEQWPRAEGPSAVRQLPQGRPAHGWRAILDLEQ